MAENDRIGHAHHGRLHVQGKQHIVSLGLRNFLCIEIAQLADVHHGAVYDFICQQWDAGLENGNTPVAGHEFDVR